MRAWKFLLLLVSILTITGCAGLYKDYGVSPIEIDQISTAQKLQSAITKTDDNDKNLNHVVSAACFNIPVGPTEADKCKQQRNAAVATLLNASDDMCQAHLKTIFGNDAAFNIITGHLHQWPRRKIHLICCRRFFKRGTLSCKRNCLQESARHRRHDKNTASQR
jgi:hypothetical protein